MKTFQCSKNGQDAWLAIKDKFAGNFKWESEICRHDQLTHTHLCKGQNIFTLKNIINQHWNVLVSMQYAAEHATYQMPNEHIRGSYFLDVIQNSDAGLRDSMVSSKIENYQCGLQKYLKSSTSNLLPYDLVQKKQSNIGYEW